MAETVRYGGSAAQTVAPTAKKLTKDQQSVFDLMAKTLESWGLSSLSNDLRNLILNGDTAPDTLALALSQTDAYKTRFAGNAERIKRGLSELNPAQYIATEEQYYNLMRAYGLPPGFYDSHTDFVKLIGGDVSPAELETRVRIAHDEYIAAPAETKALWSQYFGPGDIIAGLLDPNQATKVIEDRGKQVGIGGAAAAQGLAVSQGRAQTLQQAGVTLDQARQAYARIGETFGVDQAIAHRFGDNFDQQAEEDDLLLGLGDATAKRRKLYNQEQAMFQGGSGASSDAISVSQSY